MTERVKNVPGFFAGGQFHPIRGGKNYDGERAGDFDDIFDREIRKNKNAREAEKRYQEQLENAIRREMFGDDDDLTGGKTLLQFVRAEGGFKASKYDRGELDFLTFKESGKRGLVSETKGKSLDKIFQSATAAGYDLNDVDDLLKKLSDELGGKSTRQTGGYYDYRRNPKKAMKPTISAAKVRDAAKTLAALFPKQNANSLIKKLKKNPTAAELASATIENFDFNDDGDVDFNDVRHFAEHPVSESLILTPNDEPARIIDERDEGVVIEVTDGDRAGEVDVLSFHDVTLLDEPETVSNPAAIAKIKGMWQVILPNGRFLRQNGRIFRTGKKAIALDMASKIRLSRADELKWIQSINRNKQNLRRNPMHPLSIFANGTVGLLSALQIKDRFAPKKKKKNPPSKKPAIKPTAKNPASFAPQKGIFDSSLKYVVTFKLIGKPRVTGFRTKAEAERHAEQLRNKNGYKNISVKPTPKHLTGAKKVTNPAKPATAKPKAKNPSYKRPAYEMFQGRKATSFQMLPKSRFAPNTLDTLGRLVEIKLKGQPAVNFEHRRKNPLVLTMNGAASRLWIAGGKMGRKNPAMPADEVELIAPLEYLVYETYKPHLEGDEVERHYIHAMGEETGEPPDFALDADGYPVIWGGAYTIEDRGIVN